MRVNAFQPNRSRPVSDCFSCESIAVATVLTPVPFLVKVTGECYEALYVKGLRLVPEFLVGDVPLRNTC